MINLSSLLIVFLPPIAFPLLIILLMLIGGGIRKLYGKKIGILGMMMSGKTQFLYHLQGKRYQGPYEATANQEDYEAFDIKVNNKIIHIKKGSDIGGGEVLIPRRYEPILKDSDFCFFLFNTYKYINEEEYRLQVNARLEYIDRYKSKKGIFVFGTFLDCFPETERKSVSSKILYLLEGKTYKYLLDNNFYVLDMRNRNSLSKILKKIF